jgi:hypothetical protein
MLYGKSVSASSLSLKEALTTTCGENVEFGTST